MDMRVLTRPMAGASQGTGVNCAVTWADSRKSAAAYGIEERTDMASEEGEDNLLGFIRAVPHRMASTRDNMRLLPKPAPSLPQCKSLLVHGPYPPSAPVHLCLSVPPLHHAILISPSRHSLLQVLRNHDDPWLNAHSGTGTVAGMSSRVTVLLAV